MDASVHPYALGCLALASPRASTGPSTEVEAGLQVVIGLDALNRHRGPSWSDLSALRRLLPGAVLDLRLSISVDAEPSCVEVHLERAAQAAAQVGCRRVVVPVGPFEDHPVALQRMRLRGPELWVAVDPCDRRVPSASASDGMVSPTELGHLRLVAAPSLSRQPPSPAGITPLVMPRTRRPGKLGRQGWS